MKKLKSSLRSLLSITYLLLVVLTVPVAFDVGGVPCGLAYSLFIFGLYFITTTLKLARQHIPVLRLVAPLYYVQHLFIPSILMFFLSVCAHNDCSSPPVISVWRYVLIHSTSVFTIAEGFCSLLLIQAVSHTLSWLTAYSSDSWLFVSLIGSGATITGALFFLYRIYINPFVIDLGNASLLGSFLTLTVGLGLYGIVSGKGSMIESSLLFAYIVRCIYETFPMLSQDASETITNLFTQTTWNLRKEITRLPSPVSDKLSLAIPLLAANIPRSFTTIWRFFISAAQKLTLPLVINLAYRIGVFYAATKIIPSVYHSLPYSPPRTPQLRSRQVSSSSVATLQNSAPLVRTPLTRSTPTVISLIYAYSPCIIIAVYTHLMLSYKGELGSELQLWGWWDPHTAVVVHPWQFWNWVNMATTLALYLAELSGSSTSSNSALTSHWNVD